MKKILVFLMLGVMLSAFQESKRYPLGYRISSGRTFYTYMELTGIDTATFEILNER